MIIFDSISNFFFFCSQPYNHHPFIRMCVCVSIVHRSSVIINSFIHSFTFLSYISIQPSINAMQNIEKEMRKKSIHPSIHPFSCSKICFLFCFVSVLHFDSFFFHLFHFLHWPLNDDYKYRHYRSFSLCFLLLLLLLLLFGMNE